MTASPHCDRLDAYLDGRLVPADEADFEAHAATCEACLEASEAGVTDVLAPLGDVECPPVVVGTALAQTRRAAPDRAARRGLTVRSPRIWAGVAAALAIVAGAALWPILTTAPEPQIVQVQPLPEALPPAPPSEDPAPEAVEDPVATDPAPPQAAPAPPPPRRSSPPRPAPTPAPQRPEAVAPQPDLATADSVATAREEVLLALAIVADAQDQATSAVTDGVGRVSDALHSTPTLLSPQTP